MNGTKRPFGGGTDQTARSRWLPLLMVVLLLGAMASGFWFYRSQEAQHRRVVEENLAAIGRLKTEQIVQWRQERLADAAFLMEGPFFIENFPFFLGGSLEAKNRLRNRTQAVRDYLGYQDVQLVDAAGQIHMSLSGEAGMLAPAAVAALGSAFATRQPVLSELHAGPGDLSPHLDVIAPFFAGPGPEAPPLGAVVMRSDVDRFLYPLVQSWPVVSRTAETLLVRRDGDAVLFLNNLRHQRAAALTLRLPLSLNRLPAAQVVLGRRGVMLGRDYRGIQVLAVVGPVPHSSWFMVAKIDEAEAMADWREQQQLIFFLLGALLFSGAAATLMVWQRNAKAHYEALYRAEAALRESESRYRQLFESNPQPMWVYDIETLAFLAVNDAAVRGYGYSREEFLRMTIADIRPAEDVSRLRENVAAVTEGLDEAGLWRHRKKDGTLIDVEITSHTLEFAGRKAEVVLAHDVTEQRRAEDALRESELRFRTLADSGQALIWTATTDKLCDYFNRPWLEFTGRALEQELGNGWAEGVHPDDFSACLATYVRAFDRREKFTMSYRLRRHDGVYRWIVDTGSPRYDSQGNFLGYIGHCLDITERKEAEEALRESDIRYRQLYQKMGSGVAVYEARDDGDDFIIKDMNLAGLRSSQVTEEEIIGRSVQEVFPGVKALGLFDVLRRVWQTGTPERLPAARYEDSRLQLWVENEVYKLPSGEIVCVYNDITERREAEEAREALQSQLLQAQKMEAVGRLAGGVAHDFNNMLQAILGYTELSRSMVEPGSPLEENIREITTAARRSADLTRQLLAFARRQPANPKVLDLNETVSGMLKMLRRLVGEDIDLAWMPALELWPVHIDPSQLDQILANLLVNARDAIATVGKVTIGTENAIFDAAYCAEHAGFTPGEYVMLAVSDDGCGMDRETLRQVFEPFFTTKPAGQGTGLGLATVYGIVKQNDGFINVYSEPGQGTTFKIYLPRCAVEEVARATSAEVVAPPRGTETVLLVEDERMILALGRSMLERLGYTVLAASTVAEALQLAEEHANEIALLITDVVMPEMNGRELAARLLSVNPRLRFLFMSGYTADVIAHRGMLEEGVRFLQKPFSIHELAVKVREALAADSQ